MWMIHKIYQVILSLLFPSHCIICGKEDEIVCLKCLEGLTPNLSDPIPFCISYFHYKDTHVKKIIHSIKYHHRRDLISPFIRHTITKIENIPESAIFVPIPMSFKRKALRGLNHSELIAKELSKQLSKPYEALLVKTKETNTQTLSKNKTARKNNIKNSFSVKHSPDPTKTYIIIDDVLTTGSTITEAYKTLSKAGARHIQAITLAH